MEKIPQDKVEEIPERKLEEIPHDVVDPLQIPEFEVVLHLTALYCPKIQQFYFSVTPRLR